MAFQSQGFTSFLARLYRTRCKSYCLTSSISLFPFSTLNVPLENHIQNQQKIDESHVLDQLSDLLPIRRSSSIHNRPADNSFRKQVDIKAVDGFLSPEEKLRGVFLQKLRGKSAIERALMDAGVELTLEVVAKVVNRGNLGGEAMVTFFNWAIEQPNIPKDVDSYHIILKAVGRRKFFTHMMEVLQNMRVGGIKINSGTLSVVMDSFVRAHRVSKAIQIFGQLEEFGLKCDTESFNVLLQCLCRRFHVGVANSLLSKMKEKVAFDCMTYNLIIGGWARFGRISEIERTLEAMLADGFDPDSSTYSYIVEGLGRAGQINEAVEIFENLDEKGCAPDTCVYNAMISNFISLGDLDESLKYHERMISDNCDPNMDTYVKLISAFLNARRVADAIEMFDKMLGQGIIPATGTITSFLQPLCSYGPPHAALMIYKKARKVGC